MAVPRTTERTALPVSRYVYVVLKDDTTIRGALVGDGFDSPVVELRGAQVAEYLEGQPEPRWKTADGPVIVFRENVNYIVESPR